MLCYHSLTSIDYGAGTAVALGFFDGVHIGHRKVLEQTCATAAQEGLSPAVFTFTLPPQGGAGKGGLILSSTEKRRRVRDMGVEHYFCPPFENFCSLLPEEFVETVLVRCLGAKHVFCGDNFTFGSHKSGDVELLRALCAEHGIVVHIVPLVDWESAPVSSSRIRTALTEGDFPAVNAMLGEPYLIDFAVEHGNGIGSQLGFPTINQEYPDAMLQPRQGVYITSAYVNDMWMPSCTGFGTRPTVDGTRLVCETFIAGYEGRLYGDVIPVRFFRYLKPTVKFENIEALRRYIRDAADDAVKYFASL